MSNIDEPQLPVPHYNSKGKVSAGQQGTNIPQGWKPTPAEPIPAVRCTGTVRSGEREGEQCEKWAIRGATVCNKHGGQLTSVKESAAKRVEQARARMLGLTPDAMDVVEEIMMYGQNEALKLKAALEVLDRSGVVKSAPEVEVNVNHTVSYADEINKRLQGIAGRLQQDEQEELDDLGETLEEPLDEEDAV